MSETSSAVVSLCRKCAMPIGWSSVLVGDRIYHPECSPYEARAVWRPMSSAPTDGSRILISRRQKVERINFRTVVIGHHTGDFDNPKCWMFESVYAKASDLLGWMPIPNPPSKEG